ncbi:hypothetical protein MAPG_01802 [Magnaporthiopsis poae ATCC 64411]|uniref:4a-hydroxytetrahydrobiopterin dehydratase n=1 Tax=Magnaporthiopsis poae (strain ATCC 64411 / 73-15) TaxID=644358 RepID=A0A0C4DPN1_MAGP6|nr:hypothetical protein MAPG_01802 [Magnaporthiopsis poae ATCC 64411]
MPPRVAAAAAARLRTAAAATRTPRPPSATFRYSTAAAVAAAAAAMDSKPRPMYSAGSDAAQLDAALAPLLGRWVLTADGGGLERSFRFKTFAKTWDFMTAVSLQCKIKNHHPEWSNVYNTTFIRWTTHDPKGLSAKDVEMATKCDDLAREFGEQQQQEELSPTSAAACNLRDLASTAATSSGDCCGPKK